MNPPRCWGTAYRAPTAGRQKSELYRHIERDIVRHNLAVEAVGFAVIPALKRHLRTQYNMSPEQYREKWGLPADYPMVAPNYAAARSRLAKEMGLGQQRRRAR